MSRIFDALRKSQAPTRAGAPPPPVSATPAPPALASALGRSAAGASTPFGERATGPVQGFPLAESMDLPDVVVQQMTALRVNLEAALPDRPTRSVIFVGSLAGEGTSTVAHQFAWTLARDRSLHTLLVDVNARRPTIEVDLARRVATSRVEHELVRPGVHAPEISIHLHAMAVPDEFRRPGVYAAAAARELVEATVGSYDWVVLDGPPLLVAPDAATLSAVADGAVIVVQSGRTKRPVLSRSVDLMRKAGARVLGSVLNRRQLEIPEFIYRRL